MNKTRLFGLLSICLLISNVLLILFVFIKRPPHHDAGPKKIIIERLHFDKNQIAAYEHSISEHFDKIKNTEGEIKKAKESLYCAVKDEADDLVIDSLTSNLGRLQVEIEKTHCKHFEDIRNICRPDQMQAYNKLMDDVAGLFQTENNRPHGKK